MRDDARPNVTQEEDVVFTRGVLGTVGVVLAVILLGILWAYGELAWHGPKGPPLVRPLETPRVAGVLQTPIAPDREPADAGAEPADLQGFAWADRERREVRIPIEDAMRLVARGFAP